MRFGINSFLFVSPFVTQSSRLFSKFKKWGFDTVELPIEAPEHIDSVKVKKALDRAGLACGSVCACMGPGRDFRGSAKDQREAMKYCKALIDHMVNLGCPSLIGPVYSVVGKADAVDPKDQKKEFALVVKNLKVLVAYAEKKGVQICVEAVEPFRDGLSQHLREGAAPYQGGRQPGAEVAPRHVPHEHRGEKPGQGHPRRGQALGPLPRLRQRPRHAGQRSHRLEADRRRAQGGSLQGRCRHRVVHDRRESHRPRGGHLAQDGADPRGDRHQGTQVPQKGVQVTRTVFIRHDHEKNHYHTGLGGTCFCRPGGCR